MNDSGRRRNPFRPRTVSGPGPKPAGQPPAEPVPPLETAPVEAQAADAGQQEPFGWFREDEVEAADGGLAPVASAAVAAPGISPGEIGEPGEAAEPGAESALDEPVTMADEAAADEPAESPDEAELVELAPGSEQPAAAVTVPVAVAATQVQVAGAEPRRGSATARLRTVVLAVLAVVLTAVLGFAAGTLLPALVPGPGIASAPTAEPTLEPTVVPTLEPTIGPTEPPTAEPTVAPTPATTPAPSPTPKVTIHVVKANENLTIIAAKYGVTVKAIQELNGITNPNKIFPGQKLKIPPKS